MTEKVAETPAAPDIASSVEPLVLALVQAYDESGRSREPRIIDKHTINTGLGQVTICSGASARAQAAALLELIKTTPQLSEAIRDSANYDRLLRILQKWKTIVCFMALGKLLGWWDLELAKSQNVFAAQSEFRLHNQRIV